MLIDLENDTLEPVSTVAKRVTGKRPSPPTVWRWCRHGVRSGTVKLEAICYAGSWHTTPAAFAQFLRDQTAAAMNRNAGDHTPTCDDAALVAAGLL